MFCFQSDSSVQQLPIPNKPLPSTSQSRNEYKNCTSEEKIVKQTLTSVDRNEEHPSFLLSRDGSVYSVKSQL